MLIFCLHLHQSLRRSGSIHTIRFPLAMSLLLKGKISISHLYVWQRQYWYCLDLGICSFMFNHTKALLTNSAKVLTPSTTQEILESQTSYIFLYNLNSHGLTQDMIILSSLSGTQKCTVTLFSFKSLYRSVFFNKHLQNIIYSQIVFPFFSTVKNKIKTLCRSCTHWFWASDPNLVMN